MLLFLLIFSQNNLIDVSIDAQHPSSHSYKIELTFPASSQKNRLIQMAVWTPGSYKVREYARNVFKLKATNLEGVELKLTQLDKTTWQVTGAGQSPFKVRYELFALEETVRTNFLDAHGGFLNPAGAIFYEPKQSQGFRITTKLPEGWDRVSGLGEQPDGSWLAKNLDHLIDSPMMFGPLTQIHFETLETPFSWAFLGNPKVDQQEVVKNTQRIIEESHAIFGSFPFLDYSFMTVFRNERPIRGGLEHSNSTLYFSTGLKFESTDGKDGYYGLVAHEFFHVWNVKAIRDEGIWKFNYTDENYTKLLWFHEGWTSYYDEILIVRAGIKKKEDWYKAVAKAYKSYISWPGYQHQSLSQASFNAWTHHYLGNQNRPNVQNNYYAAGALSGLGLDLLIRQNTQNKLGLDDLMLHMWQVGKKGPIKRSDIDQWLENNVGGEAVLFLKRYVDEPNLIPLPELLKYAGLEVRFEDEKGKDELDLGMTTSMQDGRCIVGVVREGGPAYEAGVGFNDEIVAIDQKRVPKGGLEKALAWYEAGQKATLLLATDGLLRTVGITIVKNPAAPKITEVKEPTQRQKDILGSIINSRVKQVELKKEEAEQP